jgi:hypothetical protein
MAAGAAGLTVRPSEAMVQEALAAGATLDFVDMGQTRTCRSIRLSAIRGRTDLAQTLHVRVWGQKQKAAQDIVTWDGLGYAPDVPSLCRERNVLKRGLLSRDRCQWRRGRKLEANPSLPRHATQQAANARPAALLLL